MKSKKPRRKRYKHTECRIYQAKINSSQLSIAVPIISLSRTDSLIDFARQILNDLRNLHTHKPRFLRSFILATHDWCRCLRCHNQQSGGPISSATTSSCFWTGGMNLHNLTYEHAGHYPASVLLFNGRPVFQLGPQFSNTIMYF